MLCYPTALFPPSQTTMRLSSAPLVLALLPALTLATSAPSIDDAVQVDKRTTYKCKATTDCSKVGYAIPANSHYACNKARGTCTWGASHSLAVVLRSSVCPKQGGQEILTWREPRAGCNSGYSTSSSGTRCVKLAATTTTTKVAVTTTSSSRPAGPTQPSATPKLRKTYSGRTFFDSWTFWTASDPTHGSVSYLSRADAVAHKLVSVTSSGTAVISIDRTSRLAAGQPRKSVRISTTDVYQPGNLVIVDLKHVPVGCSTWPAFWMCEFRLWQTQITRGEGGRMPFAARRVDEV